MITVLPVPGLPTTRHSGMINTGSHGNRAVPESLSCHGTPTVQRAGVDASITDLLLR
ncbi:MAG: hypothetical protein ACKODE_10460 [Acidimicrobiaceae bacterium]